MNIIISSKERISRLFSFSFKPFFKVKKEVPLVEAKTSNENLSRQVAIVVSGSSTQSSIDKIFEHPNYFVRDENKSSAGTKENLQPLIPSPKHTPKHPELVCKNNNQEVTDNNLHDPPYFLPKETSSEKSHEKVSKSSDLQNSTYPSTSTAQTHDLVVLQLASNKETDTNKRNSLVPDYSKTNDLSKISTSRFLGLLSHGNRLVRFAKALPAYKPISSKSKSIEQNKENNTKMWNSRNRILIDTDGDDVAFLSGSGNALL